ncbi:MAG: peptidylprolyl isomerase [Gemmatimonadetes bacterium]|nr:peptidylprolyl isomerase [Gemmatimonadota bacterium]
MIRRTLFAGLVAAAAATPAHAQDLRVPGGATDDLVERVVAIVGDSVVTLTQLQEYMLLLRAQGQTPPDDPPGRQAFQAEALDALVNQQLILQAAARDSTLVPDEDEIESRVTAGLEQTIEGMGGEQTFQQALAAQGLTRAAYRDQLKQRLRREQIQRLFMASRLRQSTPVSVTEAELRSVFDSVKASLGQRPELITVRQAVVRSTASDSAWAEARREADSLLARVRAGEEFAAVATEATDDPSGTASGGDLGWFRRGRMVPAFERMAFALRDDQVSEPVRTEFGWHVIKVERSRPGEVKARHILVRPEMDAGGSEQARMLADSLAARVRGGERLSTLLREFEGQLNDQVPDSLTIPRNQLDEAVPNAWRQPLRTASQGDILGPFPFQAGEDTHYVVAEVTEVRAAGEYAFEDLRGQLERQLREQKQIERVLQRLRDRIYVDVRL